MNIQLLLTGDELMTGVTVDSNSSRIARQLATLGLYIDGKVTIGDRLTDLVAEINRLSDTADVLIVNGGLGPTVDDLTAEALGRAAGKPLGQHPEALDQLETLLARHGLPMNEANLKQTMLPQGCEIIPNPIGSAVGIRLELNNCLVLCTPGVPHELERMLHEQVVPLLRQQFPDTTPLRQSRFHVYGIGESYLQQWIDEALPDWPPSLELGFRAGLPTLEVKITSRAGDSEGLHDGWCTKLHRLLADHIVAVGDGTLEDSLVSLLRQRNLRLATAESATGGEMARMINRVARAGDVFEAGVITSPGRMYTGLLGLEECPGESEVSEAGVRHTVQTLLAGTRADYAVAVYGDPNSGQRGGDQNKGTVWAGWGREGEIRSRQFHFPTGGGIYQSLVAALGLDLVRRALLGLESAPSYYPVGGRN